MRERQNLKKESQIDEMTNEQLVFQLKQKRLATFGTM